MRLLLLACVALPMLAQAQENPIAELILRATRSGNPSLSFLEGLGQLEATDVDRDELQAVIYSLDAEGISIPPALGGILDELDRISLGGFEPSSKGDETRSRDVSFAFSNDPEPIDVVQGWAHLDQEVSFVLAENSDGTTVLRNFDGFRLGRTRDGMALGPKYVHFDTQSDPPVARVKVPFVSEMVIDLGGSAELPEPAEGLTAALTEAEPELEDTPPAVHETEGPEPAPVAVEHEPEVASVPEPEQPPVRSELAPEAPAEPEPEEREPVDLTIPGDPVLSLPADVLAREDQLTGLIEHASQSEQPLLNLIAGLRELDAATFTGAQVDAALAAAEGRGVEVPAAVRGLLSGVETLHLGRRSTATERAQREKGKLHRRRVEITYTEPQSVDLHEEWDHLEDERVTLRLSQEVVFNYLDYVNGSTRVWPIMGIKADRERTRFRDEHVNVLSLRYEPEETGGVARMRAGLLLYPIEVPLGGGGETPGLVGGLLD